MARSTRARNRKRRGRSAVKANQQPREMTKADICNVELLSESDLRYLGDNDELLYTEEELDRIEEVAKVNEALSGLLKVNPYCDAKRDAAMGYIYVTDDRFYEHGFPVVEFAPEWSSHVSECYGDVAETVLHHLRWNIAEHQKLLDEAVIRLRARCLIGLEDIGDRSWTLAEGGGQ